ncbi:MAG: glycosyltransferase family 2 protein [Polyangiales bacterium]
MRVRVVVPARNEAKRLGLLLRSVAEGARIAALRGASWTVECVVVTDRCHDTTASIARAHGAYGIESRAPGKVEALRAGLDADAGIHVCVDADVVLGPNTLFDLVDALLATPHALASTPPFAPERAEGWQTPLAWALHRYNARNGFSSERLWLSGRCYAVRELRFPTLEEVRARGGEGHLLADDVWLSRALLAQGPHSILRVDTDPVTYLPPRTLRGMSRVYRRMRRELARVDALFPELAGPGRDRRVDAVRGAKDHLALAIFDVALSLVRWHARFVPDADPWPVVEESKG